jgi:hypothetical protein
VIHHLGAGIVPAHARGGGLGVEAKRQVMRSSATTERAAPSPEADLPASSS